MADYAILEDGKRLYRWTDSAGQEWACSVYDHGPFCRLCQPVDGTLAACLDNVMDGGFTLRQTRNGEFEFHVTDEGKRLARHLIATRPDLAEMVERR